MKKFLFLTIFLCGLNAFASNPPIIWGPNNTGQMLTGGLSFSPLASTAYLISGSLTPSSTAVNAPKGSLYLSTGGTAWIKTDAGSSTNWVELVDSTGLEGSGTVTSVAFADGSTSPIFTITGSPISSAGTLTETLSTQAKNIVLAGPASGSNAQPTFRALVSADIPVALPLVTTIGTIATGVWNGTPLSALFGGLGMNGSASPTASPQSGAGSSATCAATHAYDAAGIITLVTTATSPGTGDQCDLTFTGTYSTAPICVITPAAATAAANLILSQIYVTSSTTKMSLNFGALDATGHTYVLNYHCILTN
jgi:hypothetical protein